MAVNLTKIQISPPNQNAGGVAGHVSWLDYLGLAAIGVISFFYSLFTSDFAETALHPSFLDFPIFIGEMLLAFCLVLLILKFKSERISLQRWHYFFMAYIVLVCLTAGVGYYKGGPLSFRHAALFYYPLFAVLGYHFFNKNFFTMKMTIVLLVILGYCLWTNLVTTYSWWTFVVLYIVLARNLTYKTMRIVAFCVVLLLLALNIHMFFMASRSHLVSIAMTFIFLLLCFQRVSLVRNRQVSIIISLVLAALFCLGIYKFADKNGLKSLMNPNFVWKEYARYDAVIKEQTGQFVPRDLQPGLYHYNKDYQPQAIDDNAEDIIDESGITSGQGEVKKRVRASPRRLDVAYNNILFRVFIWRDMWEELREGRAVFGFGLSRPQRSRSLEILNWAPQEWGRDGWITAHNSFLHIIYRAGLPGVILIITLWAIFFVFIKDFIRSGSVTGILLASLIFYWMIIANFLVFFELPYNAIPFWSLFGLIAAYRRDLKSKAQACVS